MQKIHPYKARVDFDLYFRTEKGIMEYKDRNRNLEIAEIINDYETGLIKR